MDLSFVSGAFLHDNVLVVVISLLLVVGFWWVRFLIKRNEEATNEYTDYLEKRIEKSDKKRVQAELATAKTIQDSRIRIDNIVSQHNDNLKLLLEDHNLRIKDLETKYEAILKVLKD